MLQVVSVSVPLFHSASLFLLLGKEQWVTRFCGNMLICSLCCYRGELARNLTRIQKASGFRELSISEHVAILQVDNDDGSKAGIMSARLRAQYNK